MDTFEKSCSCMGNSLDRFLQPTILMILSKESMHGFALLQKIGSSPLFHSNTPDPSGLYRYLKKMELQGLLRSYEKIQDNFPNKRIYEITDQGRSCFSQWTQTLTDYSNNLILLTRQMQEICAENISVIPDNL